MWVIVDIIIFYISFSIWISSFPPPVQTSAMIHMHEYIFPAVVLLTVWQNSSSGLRSLFWKLPSSWQMCFFFSVRHSSLFLYFWTCTIMASSCRSKVELHLFSYVGAVIQKAPQHLRRRSLFTEVGRAREGAEVDVGAGRHGERERRRQRNQCQARASFSPCTWRRKSGGGVGGWVVALEDTLGQ